MFEIQTFCAIIAKMGQKLNPYLTNYTLGDGKMIVLITGASHSGKTLSAQKLLEKYKYPYLSIDHLKMGLIRSGKTNLTPEDDRELEAYMWPIIREMIKTAVENKQNLIVEGAYIPFDWKDSFDSGYLKEIKYYCLVMSENYIKNHFSDIKQYASAVERRGDDSQYTMKTALEENAYYRAMCEKYNCGYISIDSSYQVDIDL